MSQSQANSSRERRLKDAATNLEIMLRRIRPFVHRPKLEDPNPRQPWRSSSEATAAWGLHWNSGFEKAGSYPRTAQGVRPLAALKRAGQALGPAPY